jgi:hypothetical protein
MPAAAERLRAMVTAQGAAALSLHKLRQLMAQCLAYCNGALHIIRRDQGLGRCLTAPVAFSVLGEMGPEFQPIVKAMAVALLAVRRPLSDVQPVRAYGRAQLLAQGHSEVCLTLTDKAVVICDVNITTAGFFLHSMSKNERATAETTKRLALLQKAHPSYEHDLLALAQGDTLPHYLGLKKVLYRYFFGGFHHQHMIEGLFAAMRWVDNGHLLATSLQARTYLTNNHSKPAAAATRDPTLRVYDTGAAAAGKPLRQKQSKAQNIRYVQLLLQKAADWGGHLAELGSGPLPEAAPCGDSVQQYQVKHELQARRKRMAVTTATRKRFLEAKPGISRKRRIVNNKESTAGEAGTWAADVRCACCGLLDKMFPRRVGAAARSKAPSEKARPCSGQCGNGLHASCWQLLGGEALPVDCWSCADLDQSIVPWSCRCVTFAEV